MKDLKVATTFDSNIITSLATIFDYPIYSYSSSFLIAGDLICLRNVLITFKIQSILYFLTNV